MDSFECSLQLQGAGSLENCISGTQRRKLDAQESIIYRSVELQVRRKLEILHVCIWFETWIFLPKCVALLLQYWLKKSLSNFLFIADVCGGIEPIPEKLHSSFLCLSILLPLLSVESPSEDGNLPLNSSVLRLRRHDHHPAQLHLFSHDGASGASRVRNLYDHVVQQERKKWKTFSLFIIMMTEKS